MRNGRQMPVEAKDFSAKSALYLPLEAQYDWLVNLPENIASANLKNISGQSMNSLGEVVNNAMELVEKQSEQLTGVLPKSYTEFSDELLGELLRIFNNNALDEVGGDVIGRIYEYFLNKFAKNIASDDGVFFTPKSLVKMIVNILEPKSGVLLDPACGSGGMFVQTGDFVNDAGLQANSSMTFYGQEKVEYNAKLCLMNMAVHGLTGVIKSGDEANSFYHDAHNLEGCCDYVMANPPFNVDKGSDKDIREKLVRTGHVDVMISVGNNFFYTKSLPCSLWFFDKGKKEELRNKVLFIDAKNYYTKVDRTLNEWSEWQLKNLNAIVWLYRGEKDKYEALLREYKEALGRDNTFADQVHELSEKTKILRNEAKNAVELADKKDKKKTQAKYDKQLSEISENLAIAKEANWLYEKFGEGEYRDILGLCKVAYTNDEFKTGDEDSISIEEKGWSLTPGAYVGVAPVEDDGVNFEERMSEIHKELLALQEESNDLMNTISKNMKEMGL